MSKRKKNDGAKPWEKTGASVIRHVTLNSLASLQSFLIICEGKETERRYFESFRANKKIEDFRVEGIGANTLYVVQKTIEFRDSLEKKRGEKFDQVWCVFDRNDFPAQDFNAALQLAMREGIQVAYTNEAFELWYLLHFDYHTSAYSRTQYKDKLTERFGKRYEKNAADTYEILQRRGDETQAMRFADKLLKEHIKNNARINPENDNPSTMVHCLVRELRNQSKRFDRTSQSRAAKAENICEEVMGTLKTISGVGTLGKDTSPT